jgi:hypothetical protein
MNFSQALEQLKLGYKIKRSGWNGTSLYVRICNSVYVEGYLINALFIIVNEATGTRDSWVPSSSDLLSTDWITL